MKADFPPPPGDIESLLWHKSFDMLSADERELVLQHVDSETEYESLRATLLQIRASFDAEPVLEPESFVRDSLLETFSKQYPSQKTGRSWKELLWPSGKNFFLTPAFQLTAVAFLVAGAGFWLLNNHSPSESISTPTVIVEHRETTQPILPAPHLSAEVADSVIPDAEKETLTAEIKPETYHVPEEVISPAEVIISESVAMEKSDKRNASTEEIAFSQSDDLYSAPVVDEVKPKASQGKLVREKEVLSTSAKKEVALDTDGYKLKEKAIQEQEKNTKGITLGEKPELMEFLFTSL